MVDIVINSKDMFNEITSKKIIAEKYVEDKYSVYTYTDGEEKGNLKFSDTESIIVRNGEIESKLILKYNEITKFTYKTEYFNKDFEVKCQRYQYSEDILKASYIIYDNGVKLNEIELEILLIV